MKIKFIIYFAYALFSLLGSLESQNDQCGRKTVFLFNERHSYSSLNFPTTPFFSLYAHRPPWKPKLTPQTTRDHIIVLTVYSHFTLLQFTPLR